MEPDRAKLPLNNYLIRLNLQHPCAVSTQKMIDMPCHTIETCPIPAKDILFQRYHDEEWGVPTTNDHTIFEKVCLEGFQSGLSWRTILHRRENFRQAFDNFTPELVAQYTDKDVVRLMNNKGIIRNRRKILSTINNAQRFAHMRSKHGSLSSFFWSFEPKPDTRPKRITLQWLKDNPFNADSCALSEALKTYGWTFVGPTNMYALMQALGIVNDHVQDCPRRNHIEKLRKSIS